MSIKSPNESASYDLSDLDFAGVSGAKLILEDNFDQFLHSGLGPTMHRYDLSTTSLLLKQLAAELKSRGVPATIPLNELNGLTVNDIEEAIKKADKRLRDKRREAIERRRDQESAPAKSGILDGVKERFSKVRDILGGK